MTETVKKKFVIQIKAHQTHHLLKSSKLGGIWIQLLGLLIEKLKKGYCSHYSELISMN